jgi:hypothetical protein
MGPFRGLVVGSIAGSADGPRQAQNYQQAAASTIHANIQKKRKRRPVARDFTRGREKSIMREACLPWPKLTTVSVRPGATELFIGRDA